MNIQYKKQISYTTKYIVKYAYFILNHEFLGQENEK